MSALPAGHKEEEELEDEYVHKVYDVIAPHFSHTRHKPWPKVAAYLNGLERGALVADVGCGNGKYMAVRDGIFVSGSDRSPELLKLCGDAGLEVFVADNMKLPYRSACFDAVLSIAVIHHISSPERRVEAVRELLRITRVGGTVLIYVWDMEQKGRRAGFTEQDQLIPWHLSTRFRAEPMLNGVPDEAKKSVVYKRYYHLFVEGELEGVAREAGGCEVLESYYDHENWAVVLRRTA